MTTGELLTRWTIRLALMLAAVSLGIRGSSLRSNERYKWWARACWAAGCVFYLAHVACAFEFYHHWSHSAAYRETARQTAELFGVDWGGGLYFNYVFTAMWIADAIWWTVWPSSFEKRPLWAERSIVAFFVFMTFNATVVFESGPAPWIALAFFAVWGGLVSRKTFGSNRAG